MPGNILFALSLCRKAGALVMGFDAVKDSVGKGKAQLVLCAGDLSEGTRPPRGAGGGGSGGAPAPIGYQARPPAVGGPASSRPYTVLAQPT